MLRKLRYLLLFAFLFPLLLPAQDAKTIVDRSIQSMRNTKTLKGMINRQERVKGKMEEGKLYFKMTPNPYQVYVYNYAPDEGTEVLFKTGWNNNKAYIFPNKFPFINVSFKPLSNTLLKGRHHSIYDVGFTYTLKVVEHVMEKYGDDFEQYVTLQPEVNYRGQACYVVQIDYDEYAYEDYVVEQGENIVDIDQKLRVPAYKIIEINDGINDIWDVKAGQTIKVPNVYASKVVFFIDKKDYLPLVQVVYDDEGLFERYEYSQLEYNPPIDPGEFTPEWDEYMFKKK